MLNGFHEGPVAANQRGFRFWVSFDSPGGRGTTRRAAAQRGAQRLGLLLQQPTSNLQSDLGGKKSVRQSCIIPTRSFAIQKGACDLPPSQVGPPVRSLWVRFPAQP